MDKDKDDQLNLDQLVVFVVEVKKTGLVEVTVHVFLCLWKRWVIISLLIFGLLAYFSLWWL